jgi:hypothetical protein
LKDAGYCKLNLSPPKQGINQPVLMMMMGQPVVKQHAWFLDTCGHVGYLPRQQSRGPSALSGSVGQGKPAETLVVALLSQISDLDE